MRDSVFNLTGMCLRSNWAVWADLACTLFGDLAVMPLVVGCLLRQSVEGLIKLPLVPESVMAELVVGANTKILFILYRLLVE